MKTKKLAAIVLTVVLVLTMFAGCGRNSLGNSGESSDSQPIVIKVAHTDSASRSTNVAALEFKDFMESQTNGKVSVEVYPNGQLGDDDDLVKAVKLNTCQIYIGGQGTVSGLLGPQVGITDLPYLYDTYEDWLKGSFDNGGLALYNSLLSDSGYVCLDFEYDGMRNIITTDKPVRSIDDLKGLKIRVTNTDLNLAIYKAMGANPTPMAFGEVYTGLTQGTVDGVDHCLGVMVDQTYYEPCKYLTLTGHMNSPLVVISSSAFVDSLPADVKSIFDEGIAKMAASQRELEHDAETGYLQTMKDHGVEVIELSDSEKQGFKDATAPIYDKWRDVLGSDVMDKVLEIAGKK